MQYNYSRYRIMFKLPNKQQDQFQFVIVIRESGIDRRRDL